MSYFDTTLPFSTFIMGFVASMEKENSEKPDFDTASINAVKWIWGTSSGIGDYYSGVLP